MGLGEQMGYVALIVPFRHATQNVHLGWREFHFHAPMSFMRLASESKPRCRVT